MIKFCNDYISLSLIYFNRVSGSFRFGGDLRFVSIYYNK